MESWNRTDTIMRTDKSLREKTAYLIFYLGVIIEIILVLIDKSAYTNPIEGQIFRLTFLLFFAKACLTKYSFREYAVIAFFLTVGAVSYFATGRNEIVRVVMFIAACKDIDMVKCLKVVFWMTLAGCLALILLSLFGILGTVSLTQDYGRGSVETRYVLGLGHPNALQCMVCVLTMLGMYLYHAKWKWYYYALTLMVNVFFFLLTDSKTGFLVSAGAVFLFFVASKARNKILTGIFAAGNAAVFAGSIVISIMSAKNAMCLWDYYWWAKTDRKIEFYLFLDTILTGRLHSLIETDNHEGIMDTWSLFSSPQNDYYFDMGWVRLFYWYGIIPAVLAVIVLTVFVGYFIKKKRWEELVLFSMTALYTIVEAHIISVYIGRNYLLFIVGMYWWRLTAKRRVENE
ncbi:hypothetical protein D3Z60_12465 [Lachnospiraceae bacterium]|jgi:hypothetical protein|nr:hypothetical protein [Lachnospiraceae bacterium]